MHEPDSSNAKITGRKAKTTRGKANKNGVRVEEHAG